MQEAYMDWVESWISRCRPEAEHIAIPDMLADGSENIIELMRTFKPYRFATREPGYFCRDVFSHCIDDHVKGLTEVEVCSIGAVANGERRVGSGRFVEGS